MVHSAVLLHQAELKQRGCVLWEGLGTTGWWLWGEGGCGLCCPDRPTDAAPSLPLLSQGGLQQLPFLLQCPGMCAGTAGRQPAPMQLEMLWFL